MLIFRAWGVKMVRVFWSRLIVLLCSLFIIQYKKNLALIERLF